jgi:ABC-2 type transport system permease protein
VALAWLGHPDPGLVFANYFGWWLAGLSFAALGVLASVLVSMPAIAFVIGAVFSLVALGMALWGQWFDDFNRGVVPLFNVVVSLGLIAGALGTATLVLASRRWRPGSGARVWAQVLTLLFGVAVAVNVSRIVGRFGGAYADVSVEGLSSLSPASIALIKSIDQPVTIDAFISSRDLPSDMQLKRKEVEDKLKAVARSSERVKVKFHYPEDALDAEGTMASREFGLKTRQVVVDEVTGREKREVFLGAAVSCAGNTQVIEYFDPGLSVEYEVVRAVRGVALAKKPVLGIADTDLKIAGGFDMEAMQMGGGMLPEWDIVKEWKRQYDIRPVDLKTDVAPEVQVLVVPQPSTLTEPEIEHLHNYIWNGGPALLLEDPVPAIEQKPELIPSRPKKSANPYAQQMGGGDENTPKKGDLKPVFKALGLDYDENTVVVSDYNPSHFLRGLVPNTFVWVDRSKDKTDVDSGATAGITSLLMPYCGDIKIAPDKFGALEVKPLVKATPGYRWGRVPVSDVVHFNPYAGGMQLEQEIPRLREVGDEANPPILAVEVTGRMPAAFPEPDPASKPEPKPGEVGPPVPEKKVGVVSPKPVHVIVVADVDCFHPAFFGIYSNRDGRFSDDQMRPLTDLRNVQFAGNAVDQLFNDKAFLDLRSRRPQRRPLERLEKSLAASQTRVAEEIDKVQSASDVDTAKIRADFDAKLRQIDENESLDENAKAQEKERATVIGQRQMDISLNDAKVQADAKISALKADQRREVRAAQDYVKMIAIGTPAVLLLALVLAVFAKRLIAERSHIPAARRRAVV